MPVPDSAKKLNKRLMREEVYTSLRGWILDGTLRPGEKLRDAELAERLGVSRMPVREAFRRLEDEGLVETSANRWTRVSFVDVEQAKSIYPILISLESLAISLAAPRLGRPELRLMSEANGRLAEALQGGHAVEASKADRDFHEVFLSRSDNPDLLRIVDDLKAKLRRLEVAYFGGCMVADQSVTEHKRIIEALEEGNIGAAADEVATNWQGSLDRLITQLNKAGETGGSAAGDARI
jgi:DNA-binding GntR family transcriptional regulator